MSLSCCQTPVNRCLDFIIIIFNACMILVVSISPYFVCVCVCVLVVALSMGFIPEIKIYVHVCMQILRRVGKNSLPI